jgi:hypothetical protein
MKFVLKIATFGKLQTVSRNATDTLQTSTVKQK